MSQACPKCGRSIREDAARCERCGEDLDIMKTMLPPGQNARQAPPGPGPTPSTSRHSKPESSSSPERNPADRPSRPPPRPPDLPKRPVPPTVTPADDVENAPPAGHAGAGLRGM